MPKNNSQFTPYESALRLRVGFGNSTPVDGHTPSMNDRRRTLRPHGTPDWHLLIVIEGEFVIYKDSPNELLVQPGGAILFPPHELQDYALHEDFSSSKTFWAHFNLEASMLELIEWSSTQENSTILNWADSPSLKSDLLSACERCSRYFESNYKRKRSLSLVSLEEILRLLNTVNPRYVTDNLDDRIVLALQYIAEHIREPITQDCVASHVGLSKSRLSFLFTSNLNCSMMEYIERERLNHSCKLLTKTTLPMSEISQKSGFTSAFYFSKRFKKFKNMSPSQYRAAGSSEVGQ